MGLMKKLVMKLSGTNEELEALYQEKGLCREYVEGRVALVKSPTIAQICTFADMYTALDDYDKAEELMNTAKAKLTPLSSDDSHGHYYTVLLNLYLQTGRRTEALELLKEQQEWLGLYWGAKSRVMNAAAYYDTAATVLATQGYEDAAFRYLEFETKLNDKYDPSGMMSKISRLNLLYALHKPEADTTLQWILEEIKSNEAITDWKEDYFLKMTERAKKYA